MTTVAEILWESAPVLPVMKIWFVPVITCATAEEEDARFFLIAVRHQDDATNQFVSEIRCYTARVWCRIEQEKQTRAFAGVQSHSSLDRERYSGLLSRGADDRIDRNTASYPGLYNR
jgi:hypothetical protein